MKKLIVPVWLMIIFATWARAGVLELPELPLREVLATGDRVPDFGIVGESGSNLGAAGITDDGRVLIVASFKDGRRGFFWARPGELTPIDFPDRADPSMFRLVGMSPVGWLLMVPDADPFYDIGSFQRIAPNEASDTVVLPERIDDGRLLCFPQRPYINDSGDIAFQAELTEAADCRERDANLAPAIFVVSARGVEKVYEREEERPDGPRLGPIRLLGIADDGAALIATESNGRESAVLRASQAGADAIVQLGDPSPSALPFVRMAALAVSPKGEVLFRAAVDDGPANTLYRTNSGAVVRVMSLADRPPEGIEYEALGESIYALNDRGDVLLHARWSTDSSLRWVQDAEGVLLFPADQPPRVLSRAQIDPYRKRRGGAIGVALSSRGHVVLSILSVDALRQTSSVEIRTVMGEHVETIRRSTDPWPDGSELGSAPVSGIRDVKCIAPDGRLIVAAQGTPGVGGLLCGDADGFHLVARDGDRAPNGYRLDSLEYADCWFTNDGDIIFIGHTSILASGRVPFGEEYYFTSEAAVYRASPTGITQVVGMGDRVEDGNELPPFHQRPQPTPTATWPSHPSPIRAQLSSFARRIRSGRSSHPCSPASATQSEDSQIRNPRMTARS